MFLKQKSPGLLSGAFLLLLRKNYFFLEVSFAIFLEVSAIFILLVSFLEVSAILAIEVSAFLVVSLSELPLPLLPLQAANDTAIANAKAPILIEFFMLIFLSD
jgi:hypothetical protein